MTKTDNEKPRKGSSITRVLEILEKLAEIKTPIYPFDLAHQLDIPRPSIHRLLQLLEQEGFVRTDLNGSIIAGPRTFKVAIGIWQSTQYKTLREAILKRLSDTIGETCGISMPDGIDMIYSDRIQTNWPLQVYLPMGSRVPMWGTASGKLFLSTLPEQQQELLLRKLQLSPFTKNTITDIDALRIELQQTKKNRMGTDNEEFVAGMVAFAVPILDAQGNFLASLYTHAPTLRTDLPSLLHFEDTLRQAASELSDVLIEFTQTQH